VFDAVYVYKSEILDELARHGLRPLPDTGPQQAYAGKVIELRRQYVLLSIPLQLWTRNAGE
jgi:hypothetical protein